MYMQFEEAGLIRGTKEYEERIEEKEPATNQSYRLQNNIYHVIPVSNVAQGEGEING